MRAKSMVLIVVALGCGVIAAIGINQVIASRGQSSGASVQTRNIFVTMVDIPIGEPLTPQMIKLEPWPIDKIPEGAITQLKEVEGRRPKQPLYAGEPILHRKLIDQDGRGGASEKIPPGFRVVSVKVTMDSAASGLVLPGDRVDVMVYLRVGAGITRPMTKTILTDVTVFAVNEQINRQVDGDGTMLHAKTVSLLVRPEQGEKLMLASELGSLRLSLRRADDDTAVATSGASLEDLHVSDSADLPHVATKESSKQDDSLIGLLENMKGANPAPAAPTGPLRTMEIYSPDGVNTYTWDDPTKLPRELAGGNAQFGQPPAGPPSGGADTAAGSSGGSDAATGADDGDFGADDGDLPPAAGGSSH